MHSISVSLFDVEGNERVVEFPAHYVVCEECEGEGKIVNPNVECDGGGFTASEWNEVCRDDPDFATNYFSGVYDITCPCCKGKRVVPAINVLAARHQMPEDYEAYLLQKEEDDAFRRMQESERRYGA